ncbi:MAG: armadillo-type protein [Benjaminiella poitrasii]|nr:MAG: armadillo-type protein [Benjaminiella poitrasii]
MDIFSAGCVIAELFLEGTPLFTLSQLFKYRGGEYNPDTSLDQIEDKHIRDMVKHMIQVDPNSRLSAEEYLSKWHRKAFPHYFYSFLYPYMSSLNEKLDRHHHSQQMDSTIMSALSSAYPSINSNRKLTDVDEKIERVFYDFEKIMYFISSPCDDINENGEKKKSKSESSSKATTSSILLPPTSSIPVSSPANKSYTETTVIFEEPSLIIYKPDEEGSLILLSFICSMLRNALYPSSKLKALDILFALSERLPDDAKLDRLVPYLIVLLTDEAALVRANTIKTLTHVLCTVESISPINARIFPEYIIPNIRPFSTDPDVLVRLTYAGCIALLAETALRFLEMTQLLKADSVYPLQDIDSEDLDFESAYDSSLQDLQTVIQEQATILLIDPESSVKRALLTNITCLCVFFGRQKANDVLLSHMITYLNDKDWMLRSAFFESIKGVGTFVGAQSLEEYILPLMIQALTDAEEFVVEKVLNSLTSLADLGLFQKMKLWELINIVCPLICHPNAWIRYGAIGFISSAIKHLPKTDLWCIVYPLLRLFLRSDIAEINEDNLLESMETPLSRQVYEQSIIWATKATSQSNFWKQQNSKPLKERSTTFSSPTQSRLAFHSFHRQTPAFNGFLSFEEELHDNSKEDEMFLERLRSFGMSVEDEEKLRCMREYIYKVSKSKVNRPKALDDQSLNRGEILLKNLNVTPMTVFLPDLSQKLRTLNAKKASKSRNEDKLSIQPSLTTAKSASHVQTTNHKDEDICKLSRISSQPHVQAMSSNLAETQDQFKKSSSIPIKNNNTNRSNSPIPSPSDYNFGSSLPKSLERPKSISMAMGSVKNTDAKLNDSVELNLILKDSKQATTNGYDSKEQSNNVSSVGYAHLQKLLYKIAMEAFPPHIPEFVGDATVMKRIKKLTNSLTRTGLSLYSWKPEGTLVAHFTEHNAAINQLAISFDHLLFASCSDDGSVKIWDCSRLERNVTNRSRVTYNQQGGRIKCITFIEQTYSIASASDNGSIHVFRYLGWIFAIQEQL